MPRPLQRARLSALLDALRAGIVAVDAQGRVEMQNTAASRILGVSARGGLGRPFHATLGREHPAVSLLYEALEHGRELSLHACSVPSRLGGDALVVDLSAAPLGVADSGQDGAALTLHDRTIGHELEAHVDQRTRSEVFAHLAEGIAHELRNPLGGIRGAADLLLARLPDADLQRYPELIRDEADRMRRLLDDLAELTQGGALCPRPANLHRVLDNLLDLQQQTDAFAGIDLRREYDPSIPELEIDPDRITQVFLNLVRNAAQAMAGKGQLTVRTRIEAAYHLSEGARPLSIVRVDVEDTGPGIAAADLPHIFTPFFTQRSEGTGLGLAIAQHWTVRHGGRLRVTSEPGRGTRMRVLLPLRRNT